MLAMIDFLPALPPSLHGILASAFLGLLFIILLLNIFGIPANWIILGLVVLWKIVMPGTESLNLFFWIGLTGLAISGEVLEFVMQVIKARKYGTSSSGTFAGMLGAIIGAILLAPLFWGLGALLGALAGAWLGCFITESYIRGRSRKEAINAAFGSMIGCLLGAVTKIAIGAAMIAFTAKFIWPDYGVAPQLSDQLTVLL